MNRPYVCFGVYPQEGGLLADVRCDFREQCQYYPTDIRWLAKNYMFTETFGNGTIGEIKPPPMPPPMNQKTKVDYRFYQPPKCKCPYFLPRPNAKKREKVKTPFD